MDNLVIPNKIEKQVIRNLSQADTFKFITLEG